MCVCHVWFFLHKLVVEPKVGRIDLEGPVVEPKGGVVVGVGGRGEVASSPVLSSRTSLASSNDLGMAAGRSFS